MCADSLKLGCDIDLLLVADRAIDGALIDSGLVRGATEELGEYVNSVHHCAMGQAKAKHAPAIHASGETAWPREWRTSSANWRSRRGPGHACLPHNEKGLQ